MAKPTGIPRKNNTSRRTMIPIMPISTGSI
jgi:hypothetical protein